MKKFSIRTFLALYLCLLLSTNTFASQADANTSKANNQLKLLYCSPENGSVNVASTYISTVVFNKSIKKGSNFNKISLIDNHKKQVAIITSISGSEIRIKPKYKLKYLANYTLSVPANAIKDMSNNSYNKAVTSKFKTAGKVWLSIVSSTPLDNAVNIKRDASLSVGFNYKIKKGTKFNNITLASTNKQKVDISLSIKSNTLNVSLKEKLDYSTDYVLTIPINALKDTENFPNKKLLTLKFKSCSKTLSVLEINPMDSASDISPRERFISITFDRSIYENIAFNDIKLMDSAQNIVDSKIYINDRFDQNLQITSNTNLKFGTEYIINVPANAVKDKYGNSYDEEISIKFRTTDIEAYSRYIDYQGGIILKEDGTVWAQDYSNNKMVQKRGLSGVTAIAAGYRHSIALKQDGTVWGWGRNKYGQLGNGMNSDSDKPVQVKNISGVTSIAAGYNYSMALKEDGTVWAWGYNLSGQLGNRTNTSTNKPVQVKDLSGVAAIASGSGHCMALKEDGTVWTWGSNAFGLLGIGTDTISSTKPVQVKDLSSVTSITAGKYYSVVLKEDGTVWTWGSNFGGQLGNGTYLDCDVPVQVPDLADITTIKTSIRYYYWYDGATVALKGDGTVWVWGDDSYMLGNSGNIISNIPVKVNALREITSIKVNSSYAVAYKSDGTIWVWGKLGTSDQNFISEPTLVE